MQRGDRPELLWGLGLAQSDDDAIRDALGAGYFLRNFPMDRPPQKRDLAKAKPGAIFVSQGAWEALPDKSVRLLRDHIASQRVLVLDSPGKNPDFEDILENGFLTALTVPLAPVKIKDALFRAKEVKNLYDDIFRMTQEIMLERELLARKTDQILFLNRILTRASATLDTASILRHAKEDLGLLLPIEALQAAFWMPGENGQMEADIFLAAKGDKDSEDDWIEYFLQQALALSSAPVGAYRLGYLREEALKRPKKRSAAGPAPILLPLRAGRDIFGCLAITRKDASPLGKDKSQALQACVNHLSLALKNAKLFNEVKQKADHDGLTRIHNRQAFEERLVTELRRHQRYHNSLSLLMLDVDHFKSVNDHLGHQAGDLVLREIGRILEQTVRGSDFAARYGGEEFVVLLPQTPEEHAWLLAERLRRKIAAKNVNFAGREFAVTVSIGVASLKPGSLQKREDLLGQADKALYLAKSLGRNMVKGLDDNRISAPPLEAVEARA